MWPEKRKECVSLPPVRCCSREVFFFSFPVYYALISRGGLVEPSLGAGVRLLRLSNYMWANPVHVVSNKTANP